MSENKEFDKYLKGLFDKDPKVPSELNWESMDFDLPKVIAPETTVQPKRYNRTYIGFLILTFFIASIASILYVFQKEIHTTDVVYTDLTETPAKKELNASSKSIENIEQKSQTNSTLNQQIDKKNASHLDALKSTSSSVEKQIINTNKLNHSKIEGSTIATNDQVTSFQKDTKKNTTNTTIFDKNQKKETIATRAKQDTPSTSNSSEKIISNTALSNPTNPKNITSTNVDQNTINASQPTKKVILQPLSVIHLNNLTALFIERIDSDKKPTLVEENNDPKNNKLRIAEIVLGYGYNNFNLSIDDSSILNGKINNELSQSFKAGIRLSINKKWTSNLMLNYDRYHSTFEHTQGLEPIIDFENQVKILREVITYHNNYTNTLGLQVGLERRFFISERIALYTGVNVTPNYVLKSEGKTLINSAPSQLTYDNDINKLSLNGGLNVGIMIPVSFSINVEMVYHCNKTLVGKTFINNDTYTTQKSTLSLMMSYRFQK